MGGILKTSQNHGLKKNDTELINLEGLGLSPIFGAQRKIRRFRPTLPCGACDLGRGVAVDLPYAIYDICMETYGTHTQIEYTYKYII